MTSITVSATAPDATVAMPGDPSGQVPEGRPRGRFPGGRVAYGACPNGATRGWRQPFVERQAARQSHLGTALPGEGADGPRLPGAGGG
jgi:hypothetical protein